MKNTSEEIGTKESRNAFEEYRIWLKEQRIKFNEYVAPYLKKSNSPTDNQLSTLNNKS